MSRIYTPEQIDVINEKSSCVVSAGAGSGKTSVLSERFLRLVKEGTPCNKILTITFTRKAAMEMRGRIRGLLVKHNLADQIAIFHSAKICTVDSFCQEIVRKGCRKYGIPGNFRVASSRELNTASLQIATDLLTQQAKSPAAHYLLSLTDPSSVVSFLCGITKDTNLVHPLFTDNSYTFIIELAKTTRKDLLQSIEQDVLSFEEFSSIEPKLVPDFELALRGLKNLKAGIPFFREGEQFSRLSGNKQIGSIVSAIKRNIREKANKVILCNNTIENEENIKAMYALFSLFEEQINNYKRTAGILTFQDCMKMAIDILLSDKKTRQFYKNAFSYVMIDEFQDNNDDYRCLLYLLCEKKELFTNGIPEPADLEEGKIFLVGDEKQSIYRFRGADVSVFKRMQEEIFGCGGKLKELSTNFRTNKPLLENLNTLFGQVMRESSKDFEARFKELKPGKDNGLPSRFILHLNVHKGRGDKVEGLADYPSSEAASLADLILEMTQTDDYLLSKNNKVCRPDFSDIAILLRTSSKQAAFEKALRLRGIPYVLVQQKDLVREALVNDFYSLLNLVNHRTDKLCIQSVIEGPFGDEAATDSLLDSINNIIATGGIAAAVRYLWFDMGYRAFIIANPANQVYTEHFLNLYSMAASYDDQGYTLSDFLLYLKDAIDNGKTDEKETNIISDRNDGVKIMTIHASKGLEFPIVIVADMDSALNSDNESLKMVKDDNSNPYVSCSLTHDGKLANLYDKLNGDLDKQKEIAEMIRVFYVAATRAEQHLVFSGAPKETEIAEDKLNRGSSGATSLMQMFACATGMHADKESLELFDIPSWVELRTFERIREEDTYSTSRMDRSNIEKFRPWYESAKQDNFDWSEKSIAVTSLGEQDHENRRGKILKSLDSDAFIQEKSLQTEFGTYVHALIEDEINKSQTKLELPQDLTESQALQFIKDARVLGDAFINSSLYKELSEGNCKLYPERSFRLYDSERNVLLKGTIDLLAESDKKVMIIDFKTAIVRDEEEHEIQLETYSKAVFSLYPDREVSSAVFYLRDPDNVLVRKRSF